MRAFNGDRFIGEELAKLIHAHGIVHAVETGTWAGETTRELRKMVDGRVVTIDTTHDPLIGTYGADEPDALRALGVELVLGDSAEVLADIIEGLRVHFDQPTLYYLDAHAETNPLLAELDAIGKHDRNPVIVIHDFLTPDPALGFNCASFDGIRMPLCMSLVEPFLQAIYPDGWRHHYNSSARAGGAMRGVVYIEPCRSNPE